MEDYSIEARGVEHGCLDRGVPPFYTPVEVLLCRPSRGLTVLDSTVDSIV